jgi:hypothetical protein
LKCSELALTPTRSDTAFHEWMDKNTYLPVHELDEDRDVDGEA